MLSKGYHATGAFQHTSENATHPKTQVINPSENLRIRVCFGALLEENKEHAPENAIHPKTQILGMIDYLRFQVCCVFGCAL